MRWTEKSMFRCTKNISVQITILLYAIQQNVIIGFWIRGKDYYDYCLLSVTEKEPSIF